MIELLLQTWILKTKGGAKTEAEAEVRQLKADIERMSTDYSVLRQCVREEAAAPGWRRLPIAGQLGALLESSEQRMREAGVLPTADGSSSRS